MLHKRDWFRICKVALISGAFSYIFGDPLPSFSQSIVPDHTLGSENSVVTPNVELNNQIIDLINGGASRGSTLFHSFEQFSVTEGQQVYFANPSDIANIFSRVTGNNHSDIFGTLGVLGDANLYLLNPNGIIFGPNARLDVAGSFAASTSGGVVFDNGYTFSATNPDSPPLLTVTTPLGISQWLPPTGEVTSTGNLSAGQDLSFIGQTIDLEGGQLTAGNNLKLKASDLLTIQDTATNPFIAMAGGEFVAQGNQGLTLSILNHANSGLSSNGNMTLRSANDIQLDGHYATNGQFSVEQLDGTPGNSFAADDPIVLAAGDVKLGNYEGASLHILAGGSVELGTVTINNAGPTASTINSNNDTLIPGTNTPYSALSNVTLSDGTSVTVNGDSQATLDVRAGIDWTQAPFTGVPGIPTLTDIPTSLVTFETPSLSGSNISVGEIKIAQSDGLVLLTNQYRPNLALPNGSIQVESIIADKRDIFGFVPPNPDFDLGGEISIDARGELSVAANAEILSTGLVGGNVTMNSGTAIIFDDSSKIESVSFTQTDGIGGDISLTAPTIQLTNNNEIETLYIGAEQGGAINISTLALSLKQDSRINTATAGIGNAGVVNVEADSITLENDSTISSETSFVRGGNAGDVAVTTRTLRATNGSQIFSSTAGVGNAGNVSVIATESIQLIGTSGDNPSGIVSAVLPFLNIPNGPFFADASDFPALPDALFPMGIRRGNGNAGMVSVETGKLLLEDGGQIRTTTVASGNAGQIDVNADEIEIKGAVLGLNSPIPSGILSEVAPTSKGQGNGITINTNQLSVTDSGFISASTSGQSEAGSNAGNINIDVTGAAIFDGDKGGDFDPSGVYVGTLAGATGGGGTLTINAASLSVRNGAQLEALTESSQDAGKIFVNANSIQLFGEDTGVFSNAAEGSSGNGGLIEITGNALILKDGAQISTDTAGSGNAGNTVVNVDNVITIMGENTGIFSSTTPESTGNSGSIFIDPNLVEVRDGGAISVDSEGTGTGGSIQLQGGQLILDNGRISAEATSDDGGNIALSLDNIIILRGGSLISATAGIDSGFGNGGNIQIATPFVVAVPGQNSDITANAFEGDGGNIGIATNTLFFIEFRDLNNPREVMTNDITVSSEFGVDGTFSLTSPEIDPESGLIKLPDQLADTSNQVVKTCAAAEGNVFTITGRGGVPSDPTAPIRGQTVLSDVRDFAATATDNQPQAKQPVPNPVESTSERRYLVEATGWVKNEQGEIELVAAVPQETLPNQYANCVGAN